MINALKEQVYRQQKIIKGLNVELNRLDQREDELEKENAELKADLKHFEAIKKNIRDKYKNANQVFGLNLGTVIKEGSTNEK